MVILFELGQHLLDVPYGRVVPTRIDVPAPVLNHIDHVVRCVKIIGCGLVHRRYYRFSFHVFVSQNKIVSRFYRTRQCRYSGEGVIRLHKIMGDDFIRDTKYVSIAFQRLLDNQIPA